MKGGGGVRESPETREVSHGPPTMVGQSKLQPNFRSAPEKKRNRGPRGDQDDETTGTTDHQARLLEEATCRNV